VGKEFRPEKETLEKYETRVKKQARVLETLGEPLGEGVLAAILAKATYELRLFEEAKDDPEKQIRLLKRDYAMEMMEVDGSSGQQERLSALEAMLVSRQVSIPELRSLIVQGDDVAPTPKKATDGAARSQPREPGLEPAAGASVPTFPLFGKSGDSSPGGAADEMVNQQIKSLEERIRAQEAELAAQKLHAAASIATPVDLASCMERQTELLSAVLNKPKTPSSTIRVEPKVYWPKFGDDGPGGNEVEDFYEKFEDICSLANNSQGMSDKEMLVALKSCLHGSRRRIYDNVMKSTKAIQDDEDGPGKSYREIKARLMRFLETPTERQLRVQQEWNSLMKTKGMSALQFEAEWERILSELAEVGLEKSSLDKFLAYIVKVGPPVSETIRMDRRPRKDGAGGLTTRLPTTWKSATKCYARSKESRLVLRRS